MLQTHTFKIIWSQTKHAPDTAPTTTQQSKPRAANPRVLQRTERLLEEGPAAVGVALKIRRITKSDDAHQRIEGLAHTLLLHPWGREAKQSGGPEFHVECCQIWTEVRHNKTVTSELVSKSSQVPARFKPCVNKVPVRSRSINFRLKWVEHQHVSLKTEPK